jgi:crotonobetainyl-CoA:carnitine CoA-transferase CaiB-like acyl-CoA transferase
MELKSALAGFKVIDLTQWGAASMAASLLSQWGADVIHIEHPVRGDGARGIQAGVGVAVCQQHRVNYMWELTNLNKKSLAVDIGQKEGREIIYRLAAKCDVFLSNLRNRETAKFEMDYDTIKKRNPKIIYANLTGFGPGGPDSDLPGWDSLAYFARSGVTYMLSRPEESPIFTRPAMGDYATGMTCACGIVVALLAREKQGIGQAVYTSLFRNGVWSGLDIQGALMTHKDAEIPVRESAANPLVNYYRTQDNRWIALTHLQSDTYWHDFCQAMELEELEYDPRFDSFTTRAENNIALVAMIDDAFSKRTSLEWKERLTEFGLAFGLVQKPSEAINDIQARANDFFVQFDHPSYGPIEFVAAPIKFSETPGTFRTPAPELGQHNEEILLDLGCSWDDISHLRDNNVI